MIHFVKIIKQKFVKLVNRIIFTYDRPHYSSFFYDLARKYVNYCQADHNPDMETNGESRFTRLLLKDTDQICVFDVGANVGNYTNYCFSTNPNAEIYCFEPCKKAFVELSKRFAGNPRVHTYNKAIGDKNGRSYLYTHPDSTTFSSLYKLKDVQHVGVEDVDIVTLDEFCFSNKVEHIDLLKIDTEGHEYSILEGAKEMLKNKYIGIIQFEFGDASVHARVFFYDFIDMFNKYEYTVYKLKPQSIEKVEYETSMENCSYANFVALSDTALQRLCNMKIISCM